MASEQVDLIMNQVQQLSAPERLQLIKLVADSLAEGEKAGEERYLVYGEYSNAPGRQSTEDDFKLAEWHPTEEWLNGE